jgi:hypothetical protein
VASAVAIHIGAKFDPLDCDASSAVLGQAGPTTVFRDFGGALVAGTWYPQALANALAGVNLNPGTRDIGATFNSAIGTTCPFPSVWYYGLDANPPGSQIDFVSVVLHEIGHGLGFLTLVDDITGAKLMGFNDTYMLNLENHSTGLLYPAMSNGQRVGASTNDPNLHWVGANVRAASGVLTAGRTGDHVEMYAPNPQEPGSSVSHFSTSLTPDQLMEPFYTGPNHDVGLALPLMRDIGWALSGPNTPPTISNIPGQTTNKNTPVGPIPFTVGDAETPVTSLIVSGSSSNPTLVANVNVVFGGSGANRTVTVTPTLNQSGTALITVAVSDGTLVAQDTFLLTVSGNAPPTISDILNQTTGQNIPAGPIAFTVGDAETPAASLTIASGSSNPTLVPDVNIAVGGSGANRTVTVTPALGQVGTTTITLTVSDGALTASDAFLLTVTPLPGSFFTLTPCRVADTRNPAGPSGAPALAANATRVFPAAGLCGIPTDAVAIAINVTVVNETDVGDLRLFPTSGALPAASTINFGAGHVRANNAVIPLGAGGQISVRCDMPTGSTGTTHFLFDVTGYFK